MNMDWQKILRCYIQHVVDEEGYDFLDDWRIAQTGALKDLTEDEQRALIELADNL
jgi:hypothetical protein